SASGDLSGNSYDVTGVQPALDDRRCEVRNQVHTPVRGGTEHHRAVAELLAQLVGQREQVPRVVGVGDLGDHAHARDLLRATRERLRLLRVGARALAALLRVL